MRYLIALTTLAALVACNKQTEPAAAEQSTDGGGMTMGTSPGAGPMTPVDPYSSMGGYGSSPQRNAAKDRARSAAAKAGQGSLGGYSEGD